MLLVATEKHKYGNGNVNMKNEHFELSPMEEYNTPAYPTRMENSATTLKKLPVRWVKNAAVVACLGALSISTLTGCIIRDRDILHGGGAGGAPIYVAYPTEENVIAPDPIDLHGGGEAGAPYYVAYPTEQEMGNNRQNAEQCDCSSGAIIDAEREFDVIVHSHFGGSGAGPFYVAYLTEQEALGIIRNELCEAGICFAPPVSNYVATYESETGWSNSAFSATLSLLNEYTRQGIVFPVPFSWGDEFVTGVSREEIESGIRQYFADNFGISVTFMGNPGESIGDFDWDWDAEPVFTDEEKQEAGKNLNDQLRLQVTEFIDHLRAEGILP